MDRIIRRMTFLETLEFSFPTDLPLVTVQTGLITSICAMLDLITFLAIVRGNLFPSTLYFVTLLCP